MTEINIERMDNPVLGTIEIRASDAALINSLFGIAHILAEHPTIAIQIPDTLPLIGNMLAVGRSHHSDKLIEDMSRLYKDNRNTIEMEKMLIAQEIAIDMKVPPELQKLIDMSTEMAIKEARKNVASNRV